MRFVIAILLAGCNPSGVKDVDKLCAKATEMYGKCESSGDMNAQAWELTLDRWRGLCRAVMTGETKQLLPDGLQMYNEMPAEIRKTLREQAQCTAKSTTCLEYHACEQ